MDGLNKGSSASRNELCELLADGLIFWRLSSAGQPDLWCFLFELPGGFYFVVDDDPQGTRPYRIHEHYADIISIVDRAEGLKSELLDRGWEDVDVE